MILEKKLSSELNGVIASLKFIAKIKREMLEGLSKNLDSNVASQILDSKKPVEELNENELYYLLKEIYRITEDEKFNPSIVGEPTSANDNETEEEEEVDSDYKIVKGKRVKKTKDEISRYYYDFNYKKKFANNYPKSTARVIMSLFRNTKSKEVEYNKDLHDFNLEELRETIKSFELTTIRSIQNQVSTIERYIAFAQKDKNRKTLYNQINFASELDSRKKLEGLLDKNAEDNMIFDKDEIMEMASYSDNAQDGVILGLLFDGVSHKNEFEELTELTEADIDFENSVAKLDDREVPLSHQTMILIKEALEQDRKYVSITGEKARKYSIAQGVNILRGLRGKNKVKGQIVSQRILRIAEANGYEYLNATTISYSGQLDYAKRLIKEGYTVENVIPKVLHRYGIPNNVSAQFYLKGRIEKFLEV